jgi:DNA uptake protein ComE-like DNA-binding protein
MPIAEARQVVQHRQRIGRLGSLNDLQSAGLPESTVARLRETAVFL